MSFYRFNAFSLLLLTFVCLNVVPAGAKDIYITGNVSDRAGAPVAEAKVSLTVNSVTFTGITSASGDYSIRIAAIYETVSNGLKLGNPYPNPFAYAVNIPFILNADGDVVFGVYDLSGRKVREIRFRSVVAGSYLLIWDGCSQDKAPLRSGFYIFTVSSGGVTRSGKVLKVTGAGTFASDTRLIPFMLPDGTVAAETEPGRFSLVTEVTHDGYYPVRLTDITVKQDTVIDFILTGIQTIPFKAADDYIGEYNNGSYRPLYLKGVNLGSSPPGTWPGEIAYAITDERYERWIEEIGSAGFNCIRVYTLHPPVFYEKLAEYNQRHIDRPVLLFQGIWLEEMDDYQTAAGYDLILKGSAFIREIEEVIDCVHGNREISFRYGKAYGRYETDMSQWTAGFIIGREISPQEVDSTNMLHPQVNSYSGFQLGITGASASEVFLTQMMDKVIQYEHNGYKSYRPVSISSWPTLDPLMHPTEIYTDEDKASVDLADITGAAINAGMFISYHAYPYYPNFISQEPGYQSYSDTYGRNSYLGYLTALKQHYSNIPLVIAEYGVPSSWGSAHQSYSNMHHGGYSEQQQGEIDVRLFNNILDAGCAGGFLFSWMDEWFKNTWIVQYLEALNTLSGQTLIPTRQLWQNITSPEQNFGLVAFDQREILPFVNYTIDNKAGAVTSVRATNSNEYFLAEITTATDIIAGETLCLAFDTYAGDKGESVLPDGRTTVNRSEFALVIVAGDDSASFFVTQAYDMNGLTPRFDLADHDVQKFRSTVSDGAPWSLMRWINDGFEGTIFDIGTLPVENAGSFTFGDRAVAAWSGNKVTVRIPWTMLYFYDPTQMKVVDGAVTYDGGRSYETLSTTSDGIALSVSFRNSVTVTSTRYIWSPWLIVPETDYRAKKSLLIVEQGLKAIPDFVL